MHMVKMCLSGKNSWARRLSWLICGKPDREETPAPAPSTSLPRGSATASKPSDNTRLTLAFVSTLDITRLSDLLVWLLYFEVVEFPETPTSWYQYIDSADMRGWIALGTFLVKHPEHGLQLYALDSICDRLVLKRPIIYHYLKKLSSPDQMARTQIAHTFYNSDSRDRSRLEILELVQGVLHDLFYIAEHVTPTAGSIFEKWRNEVIIRVRGYLSQVIAPRIAHVRLGKPLFTGSTNEHLPKEVKQALRLTYLYETMLLERPVPLARYGIFPGDASPTAPGTANGHISFDDVGSVRDQCLLERSYSPTNLRSQNRAWRADVVYLRKKNGSLIETNEKLAQEIATYGRHLPNLYTRPAWGPHETSTLTPTSDACVPRRLRSPSDNAARTSLPMVSHRSQSPPAPATANGDAEHPGSQRPLGNSGNGSYEDLFKGLDHHPVLSRPLLHPGTGQPLSRTTSTSFEGNCPTFRPPRPRTPQRPPSPRCITISSFPPSLPPSIPPSPRSPLKYSYSTSLTTIPSNDANTPRYNPSRSSSTKSNMTTATSTTTGTTSRSSSTASRLSKRAASTRPTQCSMPVQPGRHNSLAELQARQVNIVHVQQPISPYAEVSNPLDKARYAVSGMVRKKSSGVELRDGGEQRLGKKSSFARLGEVFGGGGRGEGSSGGSGGYQGRAGVGEMDISRNF